MAPYRRSACLAWAAGAIWLCLAPAPRAGTRPRPASPSGSPSREPGVLASKDDDDDDSPDNAPANGYYAPCGALLGVDCAPGLDCITFDDPDEGLCLPHCDSDADCPRAPGPSACDVTLEDGSRACAIDCAYARCPFDTTCQSASQPNICIP